MPYPMQAVPTPSVRQARANLERELTAESYAQLLRAEADEILARKGVAIRVAVVHRIAEIEAC